MHSPHDDALPRDQQNLVNQAAVHLEREFSGTFGRETVERFIIDSLDHLAPNNKVPAFLSLLTERFARDRLNALAKIEGLQPSDRPSVLFMCVHNAGRSQMAAGWLRHLAGDRITVYSGGSKPTDQINPAAVAAMSEVGIDITYEFPKPWTDEIVRASDVVVTMGCGDACPLFPGKRYEDWQLDDPAGRDVADVRPIRDDIRMRVEDLMASLGITAPHAEH
jgi:arsenate reductase (thioredoxin)